MNQGRQVGAYVKRLVSTVGLFRGRLEGWKLVFLTAQRQETDESVGLLMNHFPGYLHLHRCPSATLDMSA